MCEKFIEIVWDYYASYGRSNLPWRVAVGGIYDPYSVVVSEVMLQQTQVDRVIPKYEAFMALFPDWDTLASAEQGDVLRAWQGLGYNRRAKYLHQIAKTIIQEYGGRLPQKMQELCGLPGIGANTAGAIMAYAFNQPVVFVETNIRTVYLYHFFKESSDVSDVEICNIASQALDKNNPREWYWALMDYGTYLKKSGYNNITKSRHYKIQSKFEGSRRQIRGMVIKYLSESPKTHRELHELIGDIRLDEVLLMLEAEHMIASKGKLFRLQ